MMDSELPLLPSSGMMVDSAGWLVVGGTSFHTAARPGFEEGEDIFED
jgi:hypothetical protein